MPKVSIIVPAYNAEKTIGRCIESILNQTWTDLELIVLDDGSKDGTAKIIDDYADRDARVRPVHKENSGVSDTRNMGLDLAQGEYIQFLDADDWITPDATRLFVRSMEYSPECDMIISDFYRVIGKRMAQKGDIDEERLITREEYAEFMMHNPADFYYGVLWNKFYRRSIIEEFGVRMDIKLDWSEDFIFNMEYIMHTRMIYVLKVPVYYYVKTEGSLIAQNGASISKTVQMKLNVIEYYSAFYKNIYTPSDYSMRRPAIYSFMLNYAKDGSVNPIVPDKRLDQSRLNVVFAPEMSHNPFVFNFYEDRLLETVIERIMKGNDLEESDAKVLLYLMLAGGVAGLPQIRSFTGLSAISLSGSISKLSRRDIVERIKPASEKEKDKEKGEVKAEKTDKTDRSDKTAKKDKDITDTAMIRFGSESQPMQDAVSRALSDLDELQLRDLTEEEKEQYRRLRGRVTSNACRALIEPYIVQQINTES